MQALLLTLNKVLIFSTCVTTNMHFYAHISNIFFKINFKKNGDSRNAICLSVKDNQIS